MGSRYGRPNEQPVHRVVISEGFWMGETPVTQRQYALFRSEHRNGFPGNPDHPAESMTWDDAVAFCEWLSERLRSSDDYPEGMGFVRLPWEAEWEYACRGGTQSDYHSGDGGSALRRVGWFGEPLNGGSTHAVGLKLSNAYGLYDMHGNVGEMCMDCRDGRAYRRRVDGITSAETFQLSQRHGDEGDRVVRGGSWFDSAELCRAAFRYWVRAVDSFRFNGLRACLVPSPIERAV
jgi:formylglycine-generating enzyme required for sulfatase activity